MVFGAGRSRRRKAEASAAPPPTGAWAARRVAARCSAAGAHGVRRGQLQPAEGRGVRGAPHEGLLGGGGGGHQQERPDRESHACSMEKGIVPVQSSPDPPPYVSVRV